ncbi:MAG: CvpA family protein [Proteobacteria bacterium]|nr:CvpA family protein [Pseudomonadota bacterium]MDA1023107.1 CvpA family protein [Pseudomonadota bacterium]
MDNPIDFASLGGLDIGVAVILLISAVIAYARGLVHEVLAVTAWVGAIFATMYGFPYLRPIARQWVEIELVADFGVGIVIFVVALVFLSLFTRKISKKVKNSALNAVDRSLGFLFGLARGALIAVIAYIGLGLVYPGDDQPEWITKARSVELLKPGAVMLTALIPENFSLPGKDNKKDNPNAKPDGPRPGDPRPDDPKKVILDLIQPKPKGRDEKGVVGYGSKERQQMERLHDSIKDR